MNRNRSRMNNNIENTFLESKSYIAAPGCYIDTK
jgi:hypothetical protein